MSDPTPGPSDLSPPPPSGPWASDNLPQHPMAGYEPEPVEQPATIANAVKLMYVGAAVGLVGTLVMLTQVDAIREAIEEDDPSLSPSEVDTAVNLGVGSIVVMGLIGVGLWIWMAVKNGQGRSWARVVASVLGGLNILFTLLTLAQGGATALALVFSLIGIALAGGDPLPAVPTRVDAVLRLRAAAPERGGQARPASRSIASGTPSSPAASRAARSTLTSSWLRSAHSSHGPGPMRAGSPAAATQARR